MKGGGKGEKEGWQKLKYYVFHKDVDNKQERCGGRVRDGQDWSSQCKLG